MWILDTEHGPWLVARALPLFTGEHDLLVSFASHSSRYRGCRISGGSWFRLRSQVQGMGIRTQVLRDRPSDSRLFDQLDGVGRKLFLSSILVSWTVWYKCWYYYLFFHIYKYLFTTCMQSCIHNNITIYDAWHLHPYHNIILSTSVFVWFYLSILHNNI